MLALLPVTAVAAFAPAAAVATTEVERDSACEQRRINGDNTT
jgi:hypothetical protein